MSATNHSNGQQQQTARTSPCNESTKHLPARDQAAQHSSKDNKTQVLVSTTESQATGIPSSSPAPSSAASVNAIMGPPPPKDEKTGSRWERWRRDRKEAKEMGVPSQESSGRWGVKNFAA
ncbi:hypothetical protein Q7P36_005282 [Cladosporium allicinum]